MCFALRRPRPPAPGATSCGASPRHATGAPSGRPGHPGLVARTGTARPRNPIGPDRSVSDRPGSARPISSIGPARPGSYREASRPGSARRRALLCSSPQHVSHPPSPVPQAPSTSPPQLLLRPEPVVAARPGRTGRCRRVRARRIPAAGSGCGPAQRGAAKRRIDSRACAGMARERARPAAMGVAGTPGPGPRRAARSHHAPCRPDPPARAGAYAPKRETGRGPRAARLRAAMAAARFAGGLGRVCLEAGVHDPCDSMMCFSMMFFVF